MSTATSAVAGAMIAFSDAAGFVSPKVKPPLTGVNASGLGNTGMAGLPNASDEYQRLVGGTTSSARCISISGAMGVSGTVTSGGGTGGCEAMGGSAVQAEANSTTPRLP